MTKRCIIILFLFISTTVMAGPMVEITSTNQLKNYLKTTPFNGVILVEKANKVLFKKAYGYKDKAKTKKLATNDIFQIGSNTKQFVAASILKLREEGRLKLSDPVTKFLPEYEKYANIQIKDILNHTSGIINFTDKEEFWEMLNPEVVITNEEIIDFAYQYPFDFPHRTQYSYCNTGYIIAGEIVEAISGQTWDDYIKINFLEPLSMKDTGYVLEFSTISDVENIAFDFQFNLSWASSAGALYSNVDDLSKWISIYSTNPYLSNESIILMQTPFKNNYGLGLIIQPFNGDTLIQHGGRTPGFVSGLNYLKNAQLKVITLTNNDGKFSGADKLLLNFYSKGIAVAPKFKLYPMPTSKYNDYVGTYAQDGFKVKIFIKENKLFLQAANQPAFNMSPIDVDSFNTGGFAAEEFLRNEDGNVFQMKHYQNGQISIFNKVDN